MSVARVFEAPRVTFPYTDQEWERVWALGELVDARLKAGDVRLTMGGEPTFVSIDDIDGAEWNTAAVGPRKRGLADALIRRLRDRFAPGGLLHYGQGKWYPGEALPRWAFALYWRADGEPLWQDPGLIAEEAVDYRADFAQAERFMQGVAQRLEVPADCAVPAYEDPLVYLLKEAQLPENADPLDSRLDDPEERARLVRVFDRGLGRPVGMVLPLQPWQDRDRRRWTSEHWRFRRGRLLLLPGDSALGFRLPLGGLPWLPPMDVPQVVPQDPFAAHAALPAIDPRRQPFQLRRRPDRAAVERPAPAPPPGGDPLGEGPVGGVVRTALGIEPRDGRLCVFLPPVENAGDYVDLLAAIEDTAADLCVPVHIEGYTPPWDPNLNLIKVTPDPGVIEVNVQPAASWRELAENTVALYEEARQARLGTEKFMLDGRHTGTGGGNHVVVGGATPADSPFLRRPDLLGSLLAYWLNHPSLSYLFSGLFVGPTSQAPRVDEARDDQLYELEIALAQLPQPGSGAACPPWLVDRVLRNILVDVTGNTHRTEICIDKLYSPDGPTGRLGLVEFRSFEMPPHARMSLAQQLLLRGLIAWFWERPYRAPPVRWGTGLHDRFMLPHFVWEDFLEVLADLNAAGFPFRDEWFKAHLEFRFPTIGRIEHAGLTLELRTALEPWHVTGEEGAPGGTARYVDSSLERLQVALSGTALERYAVACRGIAVPLAATGRNGYRVAGVRYKAWAPSSALHPTIPVHTPLVFDLVDRWAGRSVGGCTYHVAHPGGRSFDTFPVNAYEAEGRRLARFQAFGHTPGPFTLTEPAPSRELPTTLDLRRFS